MQEIKVPEAPSLESLLQRTGFADPLPGLYDKALELEKYKERQINQLALLADRLSSPAVSISGVKELTKLSLKTVKHVAFLTKSYFLTKLPLKSRVDFSEDLASSLKKFVLSGGPSMIKLGQFISTSKGLLPDKLVDSFAWCRDSVEPEDFSWVESVLREDFGKDVFHLLTDICETPIASASIAQTHLGIYKKRLPIIIKVQRRNLLRNFSKELKAFALLCRFLDSNFESVKIANLPGFLRLFASLFVQETDFKLEALNMLHIGAASKDAGLDFVRTPLPIPELTSKRVLVMEKLEGVPYTEVNWEKIDLSKRSKLLELAVTGTIEHSLAYGIFHGDLHAGNVFANSDGKLALLDYGIVGRFNDSERQSLVKFLLAFGLNDTYSQLKAMQEFNAVPQDADLKELSDYLDREFSKEKPITQKDLGDELSKLISFLSKQGFILPPSLVLFFKNVLYLNGFASAVAPDIDLLALIEPVLGYFSEKYKEFIGQAIKDQN